MSGGRGGRAALVVVLLALLLDVASATPAAPGDAPCRCTTEVAPVCATPTGVTYGNSCLARCRGWEGAAVEKGPCRGDVKPAPPGDLPCQCTTEVAPVCAMPPGVTYSNACLARCDGWSGGLVAEGPCTMRRTGDLAPADAGDGPDGGEVDEGFLWELIRFLQTASDVPAELAATFLEYLDGLFERRERARAGAAAPPASPPPPPPPPGPPAGDARDGVREAVQRFSEGMLRGIRARLGVDEGADFDLDVGDRPRRLSEFLRDIRAGDGAGAVTLSAFDTATVYARNADCAFPFEYGGEARTDCVAVDGVDMCGTGTGEMGFCYQFDEELLSGAAAGPPGAERVQLSGDRCVFPMIFEGDSHTDCVPYLGSTWCRNAGGDWGECL